MAAAALAAAALPLVIAAPADAAPLTVWDAVAECESSGDWSSNTGNGHFGGLQFTDSTWKEFGGETYAPRADQATKEQQITIAEKVLAVQGPGAWPVCSSRAGLAAGANQPEAQAPSPGKDTPAVEQDPKPTALDGQPRVATYKTREGDTLESIAKAFHVAGGAQKLCDLNPAVLGRDPNAPVPVGVRLSVGAIPIDTAPRQTPATPTAASSTAKEPNQRTESAEQSDSAAVKPVEAPVGTGYRVVGSWASGYHTGVDFPVPTGTQVQAVTNGTVIKSGWGGPYGNEVVVRHADGHHSQYAHLAQISVAVGQDVSPGTPIGLSGSTGNSTGPHLHFEVRTTPHYGADIDPIAYLRSLGVSI